MLLRLVLLLVALCACSSKRPSSVLIGADDPRVERVGRFVVSKRGALRCAWPASQLRLRFEGRALTADIEDLPFGDGTLGNDWLAIELDGKPAVRLQLKSGRHRYDLARDLAPGAHVAVLTKRTGAEVGTVSVHGFIDGPGTRLLPAPPRRARRVEVIGDSISAGYGNEGRSVECGFRAAEADASRAYAALAARALNAELILQAWSGKGLYRNHDGSKRDVMPQLYTRILPGLPRSRRSDGSFRPHAVIVHLGTNDFAPGIPERDDFMSAYRSLLARLREQSPDALQVLVVSPMMNEQYPHRGARSTLRAWLSALQGELRAAAQPVSLLDQEYAPSDALGCHAHPGVAVHARFGRELTALLKRELGW